MIPNRPIARALMAQSMAGPFPVYSPVFERDTRTPGTTVLFFDSDGDWTSGKTLSVQIQGCVERAVLPADDRWVTLGTVVHGDFNVATGTKAGTSGAFKEVPSMPHMRVAYVAGSGGAGVTMNCWAIG